MQVIGIAAGTKLNIDQFIDNLHAIIADESLVFTASFDGLDTIVDKITKSTCDMGKQSAKWLSVDMYAVHNASGRIITQPRT